MTGKIYSQIVRRHFCSCIIMPLREHEIWMRAARIIRKPTTSPSNLSGARKTRAVRSVTEQLLFIVGYVGIIVGCVRQLAEICICGTDYESVASVRFDVLQVFLLIKNKSFAWRTSVIHYNRSCSPATQQPYKKATITIA